MMTTIAAFFAGVSAAVTVKLASSIDDVLWLSSFLTPSISKVARIQNVVTYVGVCLLQTCLAYILSQFGESVLDNLLGGSDDERMSTDRLFTLISGSALFLYFIVLGVEYYKEHFGDTGELYTNVDADSSFDHAKKSDDQRDIKATSVDLPSGQDGDLVFPKPQQYKGMISLEIEDPPTLPTWNAEDDDDNTADPPPYVSKSRSLAIIAFLGSLDDLTLFVPMLVGRAFGIIELIIGAMLATLFIVMICIFLTRCRVVADLLEKIPLVAIVFSFSVILLVKGIFFM